MNLPNSIMTKTKASESKMQAKVMMLQHMPQYVIYAGLGVVGGATGVALTIGAVILIQFVLFPTVIFSPGTIPLTLAAVLAGLGVAWLLNQVIRHVISGPSFISEERELQLLLTCSALASLVEAYLFLRGL